MLRARRCDMRDVYRFGVTGMMFVGAFVALLAVPMCATSGDWMGVIMFALLALCLGGFLGPTFLSEIISERRQRKIETTKSVFD